MEKALLVILMGILSWELQLYKVHTYIVLLLVFLLVNYNSERTFLSFIYAFISTAWNSGNHMIVDHQMFVEWMKVLRIVYMAKAERGAVVWFCLKSETKHQQRFLSWLLKDDYELAECEKAQKYEILVHFPNYKQLHGDLDSGRSCDDRRSEKERGETWKVWAKWSW